jgi:hypothetical protein
MMYLVARFLSLEASHWKRHHDQTVVYARITTTMAEQLLPIETLKQMNTLLSMVIWWLLNRYS